MTENELLIEAVTKISISMNKMINTIDRLTDIVAELSKRVVELEKSKSSSD